MATAVKNNILTATYSILLFFLLLNIAKIVGIFQRLFSVLSPFLIGFAFAYLLNGVYALFHDKLLVHLGSSEKPFIAKLQKPLSLFLTYFVLALSLGFLFYLIIPQLAASVNTLMHNIPQYMESYDAMTGRIFSYFQPGSGLYTQLEKWSAKLLDGASSLLSAWMPQVFGMTKSVTTAVFNLLIGFVVSVYLLASKDRLKIQMKKLCYVILPERLFQKVMSMAQLVHCVFGSFIRGQLLDSLFIGCLTALSMWIFHMPFPLLIGVIIGVTNVIPLFGPFIGAIPSALIVLMVAPSKTVWFVLLILVLQQIEGNLIAPKVVGDATGLSGLWVIFAITVGGGLFGVAGMLIGVPVFAVIYKLTEAVVQRQLEQKESWPGTDSLE